MRLLLLIAVLLATCASAVLAADWKPLADDDIHDPGNPALDLLQEPADALSQLPADAAGNKVDWVKALREGYVEPRTNVHPETKVNLRETELIMKNTGSSNYVRFPHLAHTEWLDCSNCHDHLFAREVGKTPMTMLMILSGEYCGRCHGAVAVPLTECNRCHSVSPFAAGQ
jgi:c(7)-type cytochrome triheme protein